MRRLASLNLCGEPSVAAAAVSAASATPPVAATVTSTRASTAATLAATRATAPVTAATKSCPEYRFPGAVARKLRANLFWVAA